MDGCFPRCINKHQSVAECVAVIRYIYITHVFSDKRRENKGLVQITSSQNILLLSATSTSCSHGAPLARRPPFLHCSMPKSKQWLCSRVLCLISVMEITLSLFPCLFPSGPSFGADCGHGTRRVLSEFPDTEILCVNPPIRSQSKSCSASSCRETHGQRGEMHCFFLWLFFLQVEFHYRRAQGRVVLWWFSWYWSQRASFVPKVSIKCKLNLLSSLVLLENVWLLRVCFNLCILKWNILFIFPSGNFWLLSLGK